jgi:iron(III) transport system ATP-binding protein
MTILSIESLEKRYDRGPVLQDVSLQVDPGEFVILIGGSGSGKTTLLRVVGGLEKANGGTVRLRGELVDAPAAGRWVPPERRRLGMVFQDYALWPHLSCLDNVVAAIAPQTPGKERIALNLLDRVGVASLARQHPGRLSGGQQQRVGLARALATKPDLLLLDEPLSSLDVDVRDRLRVEIRSLARDFGMAALFVSHDPLDAWRLADRILVLEHGILSQADTPQALYAKPGTPQIARFVGAQGGYRVQIRRSAGCTGFDLAGSFQPATAVGPVSDGTALAFVRPQGVRVDPAGVPATVVHCAFEAGLWRVYWRLAGLGEPLCSLETEPLKGDLRLTFDPAHIFIYQDKVVHSDA